MTDFSSSGARARRAFTLIELLIVVAIIAVLAAIAVPNFLEAQTRARVSRSLADLRAMSTAVEAYHIDFNAWPLQAGLTYTGEVLDPTLNPTGTVNVTKFVGRCLTTPVAYIATLPQDPFVRQAGDVLVEMTYYFYSNFPQSVDWVRANNGGMVPPFLKAQHEFWGDWVLMGAGPDGDRKDIEGLIGTAIFDGLYDPTNGTVSNGDVAISPRIREY